MLASGPALVSAGVMGCLQFGIDGWSRYVAALVLGAMVAVAELVSRYRDSPATAMASASAAVYLGVNAGAAMGALYLIDLFGWRFGAGEEIVPVAQVIVAGLGSATVFRSSVFTVAAGDQNIGIGPNAVLSVILAAADRGVDRQQALARARQAHHVMQEVSFEAHAEDLSRLAVATMQNVTPSEVETVEHLVTTLRDSPQMGRLSGRTKSELLALALLGVVGPEVLSQLTVGMREGSVPPAPDDSGTPRSTDDWAERVRRQLGEAGGRLAFTRLQASVGLPLVEFGRVLGWMLNHGLIELDGPEGEEDVVIPVRG